MSYDQHRRLSLAGIDASVLSVEELRSLVCEILQAKIHGISFSPYVEGQKPGAQLTEAQIRERLEIVRPHVHWVRTFSCTQGNESIPRIAKECGLKVMAGVWLDDNQSQNENELTNGIEIARAGDADILAVGNEVLLRDELTEEGLIDCIRRAKESVSDVDIGYVDAYFKFAAHPRVTEACDVVLANCYPFWEGYPAEHALLYMKEMYRQADKAANGKKVIVSETGWPNIGSATESAIPSWNNAIKYFVDTYRWAEEDGIEVFYFSAFDESWKIDIEGDVGAYWGLWDEDGNAKYC